MTPIGKGAAVRILTAGRHWHLLTPLVVAALATALNAAKAPLIDDPAYLAMARQIARSPLDPYGFDQFWYSVPQPANEILAPPVLPYWLGLGMRIFGDEPLYLKFWLFPVMALFAAAWYALLRRFARAVAGPVLLLTVLSPVLIPNWNFMLDVPATALALTALAIFLFALERNQLAGALLSGVVAGLAAQTKYTGGLVWPLLLLTAWCGQLRHGPQRRRRLVLAVGAVAAAAVVFAIWEVFVAQKYGVSHFVYHMRDNTSSVTDKIRIAPALLVLLGGMLPPAAALAFMGMRWQRGFSFCCVLLLTGYGAILAVPGSSRSAWAVRPDRQEVDVAQVVFVILGLVAVGMTIGAAVCQLLRWRRRRISIRTHWHSTLLAAWLALEIVGYFALTPFSASRRVLGLTMISVLLGARLLSFVARNRRAWHGWLAVIPGIALGVLYNGLTIHESHLQPDAVRTMAAEIRTHQPQARIWFLGHWGFQYEAERLGLMPVVMYQSRLEVGDWLIWPDAGCVVQQAIQPDAALGEASYDWEFGHSLPVRALPPYYGGHLPMERWPYPQLTARAYRIRTPWTPVPPRSPEEK